VVEPPPAPQSGRTTISAGQTGLDELQRLVDARYRMHESDVVLADYTGCQHGFSRKLA